MASMKRGILILFLGCMVVSVSGQKSRVLSVMQMIDSKKYSEAKEAIELAVENSRTAQWPRTYYVKGLLCQTAYEDGVEKADSKLTKLYEDQLYVAYDAYERALELDARQRTHASIAKKYYALSNDFRQLGQAHYKKKEYAQAMRAFEHALLLSRSELLSVPVDTSLVYNAALAAYESKNWEKAIGYLTGLHDDAFSTDASLFLIQAHLQNGDTLEAETTMLEGVKIYGYSDTLVMQAVNWFTTSHRSDQAIEILEEAIERHPDHFRYYWALGLVYGEMEDYPKAIESFKKALDLTAETPPELYYQIGMCYYNMGIELREEALQITENDAYMKVRDQYLGEFREAVAWLEKSYELDPDNESTINRLYQLYYQLQMKEKQESLEQLIR
jgi:tetratricopeptide (TPR) repeat protein